MKARSTFLVLVLINLVLAALLAWTVLMPPVAVALPPEEHADQVRLPDEAPASVAVASAAPVSVVDSSSAPPANVAVLAEASAVPASAASSTTRLVCLRWGDFTTAQWREARNALRLQLGTIEIEEFLNEDKAKFWVYMPPFDSLEAARVAVADLKANGVVETFIIQDGGPQQLAISLGLFSKKAMAEEFASKLMAKGIDRVVSKPHPQSRYISILMRDIPEPQKATVRAMSAGFENTSVQELACATR